MSGRAAALKDSAANWQQHMPAMVLELLILAGAFVRFFKLAHESLNYDELASVWTSKLPLGRLISEAIAQGHPPVFNLLAYFWPMPAGGEIWARFLSAFFGVLIIPLIYATGKEIHSRRAGLWAAAFAAISPLMVWYARDATSYSWLTLVSLLSFYFLARCSKRGGWKNWALYIIATLLMIFSFYLAFIMVFAGLAVYWLLTDSRNRRVSGWAVSHVFLGMVLTVFFLLTRSATAGRSGLSMPSLTFFAKDVIYWPIAFVQGYASQDIGGGVLGVLITHREAIIVMAIAGLLMLALAAFKPARRMLIKREIVAAGVYLLILVAGPVAVQLAAPGASFAERYYAWAAPAFALFLGLIVSNIPPRLAFLAGTPFIAAMLYYSAVELKVPRNENWRGVMSIIAANRSGGDEMLCFPETHCAVAAAFYLPGNLQMFGGYVQSYGADLSSKPWGGYSNREFFSQYRGNELDSKINSYLQTADRVWLVSGDGALGNYPASPQISAVMAKSWKRVQNWDMPPLDLGLFVRRNGLR